MRRLLTAVSATAVLTAGIILTGPVAEARQGCVSRPEFRNTKDGTPLLGLEDRYETHGRLEYQGGGFKTKTYPACYGGDGARVWVEYRHHHDAWRVHYKWYVNGE